MDFEEAGRLRDQISVLRGRPDDAAADIGTTRFERQRPGAVGLGASDQKATPPPGWKPPLRPDFMTTGHTTPKRRR